MYTIHHTPCPNAALAARLTQVWQSSVRATHTFLTEENILHIRGQVQQMLPAWQQLYTVRDDAGVEVAFLGMDAQKIEMLFVDAALRGRGIGKMLLQYALHTLGATAVDVNEQNPEAAGFYTHFGFVMYAKSPDDGQGNPFPILHMHLPA